MQHTFSGGCHSHRLYSHSCDCTLSMVNGQTAQIGALNGQSGVEKMVNIQIPVRNKPQITVLQFAPNLWVARSAYFLTYRLADSVCSSNIETPFEKNI